MNRGTEDTPEGHDVTYKRRSLIAQPGEHLLLPSSIVTMADKLRTWLEFTGHTQEDTLLTPMSTVPLPVPSAIPAGRRRWDGTRPEAMWHPLLWLTPRMTTPRRLVDTDTGIEWNETYPEWAVRTILELVESAPVTYEGKKYIRTYGYSGQNLVRPATKGDDSRLIPLYDHRTGTWLDILDYHGVNIDTRDGVEQVRAWLDGAPDATLDAIDLEHFLSAAGRDDDWALDRAHRVFDATDLPGGTARMLVDDLRDASTALVAHELADLTAELIGAATVRPPEYVKSALTDEETDENGNARPALAPVTDDELARLEIDYQQVVEPLVGIMSLAESWVSLPDGEMDDLVDAIDRITLDVEDAATGRDLIPFARDLRDLLATLASEKVVGVERLRLRDEIEAEEILDEIVNVHDRRHTEEELIRERAERDLIVPEEREARSAHMVDRAVSRAAEAPAAPPPPGRVAPTGPPPPAPLTQPGRPQPGVPGRPPGWPFPPVKPPTGGQ